VTLVPTATAVVGTARATGISFAALCPCCVESRHNPPGRPGTATGTGYILNFFSQWAQLFKAKAARTAAEFVHRHIKQLLSGTFCWFGGLSYMS